jgi:hypothetical protein
MKKFTENQQSEVFILPLKDKYGTREAATLLGLTVHSMRRYGRVGTIDADKTGHSYKYKLADLVNWFLSARSVSTNGVSSTGRLVSMIPKETAINA